MTVQEAKPVVILPSVQIPGNTVIARNERYLTDYQKRVRPNGSLAPLVRRGMPITHTEIDHTGETDV